MAYSAEQIEQVCQLIETSDKGVSRSCAECGLAIRSFYDTIEASPALAQRYARAKERQADYMADQILEIADDGTNDWMACYDPDNPGYQLNGEHTRRSSMRIDARKWLAAKLKPKSYGDKLQTDGTLNVTLETPESAAAKIADIFNGK